MTKWFSGDVLANGIKIHYSRTGGEKGNGKPVIILSHGFSDNGLCWSRVAWALESEYDIIMPDARGHGFSEAPADGYNSVTRAADLAGFIQALGLDKPAIGGHSMGASITLYTASLYPDLMRLAILEDGGTRGVAPAIVGTERITRMYDSMRQLKMKSREEIIAQGRSQSPLWDESEFGDWADAKIQMSEKTFSGTPGIESIPWQDALKKVKCPVLLITADPDKGSGVTAEAAAEAQNILPSLKVVHLSGAGHNIRRERFDGFVPAVREFLAQA